MKYPRWFPYPSSWLNALLLGLLMELCVAILEHGFQIPMDVEECPTNLNQAGFSLLFLGLVPIFVITFTHHIIHSLLSKFFPNFQAAYLTNTKGFMPRIISWWEGFQGFSIVFLTACIVGGADFALHGIVTLSDDALALISLTFAAYIYQLLYLVEEDIIRGKKLELSKRP